MMFEGGAHELGCLWTHHAPFCNCDQIVDDLVRKGTDKGLSKEEAIERLRRAGFLRGVVARLKYPQ